MKIKPIFAAIVVLTLCYVGAGAPAVSLLVKPSVIWQGVALKAVTYHWVNHWDRAIPEQELLASRFYIILIAVVSFWAGVVAFKPTATKRDVVFLLIASAGLLVVFVYAQLQAYYTVA